jgi:hypothetical protein
MPHTTDAGELAEHVALPLRLTKPTARDKVFCAVTVNHHRFYSSRYMVSCPCCIKVKVDKSPFDGDQLYWATRLGYSLKLPVRKAKLLKRQRGKSYHCGLFFSSEDVMEIHHRPKQEQQPLR